MKRFLMVPLIVLLGLVASGCQRNGGDADRPMETITPGTTTDVTPGGADPTIDAGGAEVREEPVQAPPPAIED